MPVAHPWLTKLFGEYLNVGPNSVRYSERAQRVIGRSGPPLEQQTGALSALFQFVYGFGTIEDGWKERCRRLGVTGDAFQESVLETITDRPEFQESMPLIETARA